MWPEPLTAATEISGSHTVAVTVRAGDGVAVARVLCAHGASSRCGVFGEMRVLDAGGAPRQTARALVLLVGRRCGTPSRSVSRASRRRRRRGCARSLRA